MLKVGNKQVFEVIEWAVNLADTYNVGVQGIIASFISARKELQNDEAAKEFVERETSELRRKLGKAS